MLSIDIANLLIIIELNEFTRNRYFRRQRFIIAFEFIVTRSDPKQWPAQRATTYPKPLAPYFFLSENTFSRFLKSNILKTLNFNSAAYRCMPSIFPGALHFTIANPRFPQKHPHVQTAFHVKYLNLETFILLEIFEWNIKKKKKFSFTTILNYVCEFSPTV